MAALGGALVLFVTLHTLRITQRIACAAVFPYMFLILSSTVISRTPFAVYQYKLIPFWSYMEIMAGSALGKVLPEEVFWNILMLMPLGFFLPFIMKKTGRVILTGFLFSLVIELLQLILKRGFFEFDDIMHNTLGVIIGVLIIRAIRKNIHRNPASH